MSDLFSHSPVPADALAPRSDLHSAVDVPAPTDHAWAGLTQHLHLWWPAEQLSRWGAESFFDLEDKALVETSAEDDENVWGEVTAAQQGQWLELRWRHLGSVSTTQVRIEVSSGKARGDADAGRPVSAGSPDSSDFSAFTLVHRGWTREDPDEVYDFYADFWQLALGRFRRFMGGA